MAASNLTRKVYFSVVEDVISNVREEFLNGGVDEQVVQELKQSNAANMVFAMQGPLLSQHAQALINMYPCAQITFQQTVRVISLVCLISGRPSIMADLNKSLKDYLLKSQSKESLLSSENTFGDSFSLRKFNPFRNSDSISNANSGAVTNSWFSQAQKDAICPGLSKKQRILGFVICLLMGTFCFSLAMLYIPLLVLKARKFAMLYTVGSLFIIGSFSMLWGPMNHVKHLCSMTRLPFTAAYFGTMFATVYFSIWVQSTFLTVIFAMIQILALVWYIISYIPGGQTGLKFFSKVFYAAASKTTETILPI